MRGYPGVGHVLAIGLTIFPTVAFAGAWTLDAGQGVAIVTATASRADKAFDGGGNLQSIPRYSKNELQALFEFGATSWLTLMLAPSLWDPLESTCRHASLSIL